MFDQICDVSVNGAKGAEAGTQKGSDETEVRAVGLIGEPEVLCR